MNKLRIILADDHPVVRTGLRLLLESGGNAEVVAEAGSPASLFQALGQAEADLLLTDFIMPGGEGVDGLAMLSRLRAHWPRLPVVVLTMAGNANVLQAILGTGVRGLLDKSDTLSELTLAISTVANGRSYVGSGVRAALDAHLRAEAGSTPLSRRETEVLRLFASGMSVSEIARHLNRSVKTISHQKVGAMNKLGLHNDLEIYAYARDNGLIP
ncbi:response regulator transcription factor [Pseudoxanthomonas suwonensis]|uniref:response regulator transcription factor n=1 Tax=Pseudoxanthomonas suwonensis TaxID=314722 RepID=UPI00138ED61B|nr:response regulator transcription factor [Pseudoxanthomonas suwonensis]KAF1703733.1 DNA-binding response regulator [Pseudoxanthomonas suwonensis]